MKNKIIFLTFILLIAIIFCIYSGYNLVIWNIDNNKTKKIANNIKIISKEEVNMDNTISIDFTSLLLENKEIVGWIKVNNTNVDYPVVKHTDNEYYLNHSIDNSNNNAGWIFMDYRNNYNNLDFNTIIYGHGRRDGSMFGSLNNLLEEDWINNKDNLVIKFTTINNSYLFKIFSIYVINTTNDYINTNYDKSLIEKMVNRSIYKFNDNISINDKILTLSTCYNNDKKIVVHAKMIHYN